MRKRLLCISIAALMLALLGGSASAKTTVHPNGLVFNTTSTGPTTVQYSGQVFGDKFCRVGRTVDIFVGGALLATVSTDANGNFSASGPKPPPGTEASAVSRRKVQKTKKGKQICQSKTEVKKVQQ